MKNPKTAYTGMIVKIGLFTAVALLVSFFEFPLWFAPDFYTIDFSSAVALLGSYFVGPLAGIIIATLKTIFKAFILGTTTAYVGEYVDIIITILYVFPAAITYRNTKTHKGVISGMLLGGLSMTFFGCILNYFLLIPIYARIIGLPEEMIVESVNILNGSVKNLGTMVLFITAPFNILKSTLCSTLTYLCFLPLNAISKLKESKKETKELAIK